VTAGAPGNSVEGWGEYRRLFHEQLSRVQSDVNHLTQKIDRFYMDELTALRRDLSSLQTEIGQLKVKAGVWGAIGALIPTVGALVLMFLSGKI
jgi:hypothetical protein